MFILSTYSHDMYKFRRKIDMVSTQSKDSLKTNSDWLVYAYDPETSDINAYGGDYRYSWAVADCIARLLYTAVDCVAGVMAYQLYTVFVCVSADFKQA